MSGSFAYSRDADVAASARERLDRAVERAAVVEASQRDLLAELIGLWPSAAWLAAGATSAKNWLLAYTNLSYREAQRLERIAELCAAHPDLADAVVSGALTLRRAEVLARVVTAERAPFLDRALGALLTLNGNTSDDEVFEQAVGFWRGQVDQELSVRRDRPQSLVFSERLFGGGEIHGSLAPVPFATVKTAVDAYTQDPDPADAPYRRCLSERRADALDDLATFALTHDPDNGDGNEDGGWDEARANIHIDLRTLAGIRDIDDLDDLVLRGEGWRLTRGAPAPATLSRSA